VKTFQEFIVEAEAANSIKSLAPFRIMPPLKTKGGESNPAPQRFLINPKTGLGPTAQIVPTSKTNQIPFKYSTYGIDTTNREEGLKKKVRTLERLGILHGGTRAKDLQ
jgi:hypothetical protein